MKKKLLVIITGFWWLFAIQLHSQQKAELQSFKQLFDQAEILFNGSATDSTDSVALSYYTRVISNVPPDAGSATLLYNCYERAGILKQGLGYTSNSMLRDYHTALSIQKRYQLGDSVLFRLLLSMGNVYYTNALFDSSVYYFTWAEKIINRYPNAGLAGDLYNSLGALYNEAGNYVQSGFYFSKALELTRQQHPELGEALFAMSANVASAVRASGHLDSALCLYKKLLQPANPSVAIINNISEIYLNKKLPDSALQYLQLVKNAKGTFAITIHNAFAKAWMLKKDTAQAQTHLVAAYNLHQQNTVHTKSNHYAATRKIWGDLLMMVQKPQAALMHYQQAIIQYDFKFNDTNVFANPGCFVGDFASYNLFNALSAKAACLAAIYTGTKEDKYYYATISTYDSAFALADYIKKSFENDEARLFIADKVFDAYTNAIDFAMSAHPQDAKALVHALGWVSKSRATSLAINLKENTIKQFAGLPDSLLQQEKNTGIRISRLKLQLQQATDTTSQKVIVSDINTAALQLQSIENKFKEFPSYYNQKFAADNFSIQAVQEHVLNNKTAAICFFKGAQVVYAFVIRHDTILMHVISNTPILANNIRDYVQELTTGSTGKAYDVRFAKYLYAALITPLEQDVSDVNALIVIPDQQLINVPFEAFESADGKYLMEKYAITYQYALPFVQKRKTVFNKNKAIVFAPFATNHSNPVMGALPSSLDEITTFSKNERFVDNAANKAQFMALAGSASVIHLATHAVVDFQEPENSYVAFYPQSKADSSYKIYAHELYNLELPHTQFVFLSACETGSGKVSQSEGALSISRAFAFAGCPNIVTSLWKAEDKSTAYISKHFYEYVDKGYTYAGALQKAKQDLLADETMSQFHSPLYWSHLIFIGDVQEQPSTIFWWILLAGVIVIGTVVIVFRKIKSRRV